MSSASFYEIRRGRSEAFDIMRACASRSAPITRASRSSSTIQAAARRARHRVSRTSAPTRPSRSTIPTSPRRSRAKWRRARSTAASSSAAPGIGMAIAANKVAGIRAAPGRRRASPRGSAASTTTRTSSRSASGSRRADTRAPHRQRVSRHAVCRRPPPAPRRQDSRALDDSRRMIALCRCRTSTAADPDIAAAIQHEVRRQEEGLELIASENFVSLGRARGGRLGADEQVRRGLSGQAVLRRLRVRRRRRVARDRAREAAVRRRARQRAAALGRAGQHGRLHRGAQAGRHDPRHEPRARRPPHARPSAELLGQVLQHRPVRRAQGRRAARLRRARSASRASTSPR